jgi:pilus assembly protein Flp/PilA
MAGSFATLVRRFAADDRGATAIEYALIASGIGATVAATVYTLGSNLKTNWWDKIGAIL